MDFTLSNEHQMLRKMYREFAENEVKPLAQEIDEEERFPRETVEKMAKLGMLGIPFPKRYGGAGGDNLAYALCVEELAKHCGTTSVIVCAHTSLCCYPIYAFGTEEQKMKYLPDLLSGRKLGAFGLTEPNAGSDASGQQTVAELDESGENYILNGSKCFITNATEASTFVVFAMTDKHAGNHGISAFIVEGSFPGFSSLTSWTASSPGRTSWGRRGRASGSPWAPWTAGAWASRPRPWGSGKAPSTRL